VASLIAARIGVSFRYFTATLLKDFLINLSLYQMHGVWSVKARHYKSYRYEFRGSGPYQIMGQLDRGVTSSLWNSIGYPVYLRRIYLSLCAVLVAARIENVESRLMSLSALESGVCIYSI
jgi:hypothetical protein